jgi:small ubiquitin-related modifier
MGELKDEKTEVEHINVKVTGSGSSVHFKIKKSTSLRKLMEAYCEKTGNSMKNTRFFVDGNRIREEQTAEDVS